MVARGLGDEVARDQLTVHEGLRDTEHRGRGRKESGVAGRSGSGDADAFRAALERVIAHPDEARESARLGRKHIIEYMDAGRVAHAYTECYKTVLGMSRDRLGSI